MDNEEVDLLSDELENLENEKIEQIKREEEERQAQEKAERMAAEKAVAEEQLRIEKERLSIEKERASLAQSQTTNVESKTKSSSSCLSILLVFVVILGGGAYYLFSSNGAAVEETLYETFTDDTNSREFVETLGNYASEGIEAANAYKVKKLQLQPSATQYNYKGTITYERLGRDFTNAITVTYDPEKGSIKWNILETQEELDFVNSDQHASSSQSAQNMPVNESQTEDSDEEDYIVQDSELYEYEGMIDNSLPVTIMLERMDISLMGEYYYNKYGPDNMLTLRGSLEGADLRDFTMEEFNSKEKKIGVFKGRFSDDFSTMSGTYTLLSKNKTMLFTANTSPTKNGKIGESTEDLAEHNDDDQVFPIVDVEPEFPGGTKNLMEFISKNLRYPASAANNNIQGKVSLSFVVEKDGSISNIKELSSPSEDLTKEAMRVVQSMPRWKPGMLNGAPARVKFMIPITFRIDSAN